MNREAKISSFLEVPVDRNDFLLYENEFIEIVCFLYWRFENIKFEIRFYTVLSDLQNQVIKIPIDITHTKLCIFLRVRVASMIIWWCFTTLNMTAKIEHSLKITFCLQIQAFLDTCPKSISHFIENACWEPSKSTAPKSGSFLLLIVFFHFVTLECFCYRAKAVLPSLKCLSLWGFL